MSRPHLLNQPGVRLISKATAGGPSCPLSNQGQACAHKLADCLFASLVRTLQPGSENLPGKLVLPPLPFRSDTLPVHGAFCALLAAVCPAQAQAEAPVDEPLSDRPVEEALADTPTRRLYRTREEQREAGLERRITPWLTASGLVEFELLYQDFDAKGGASDDTGRDDSAAVQLGLVATPWELSKAELILEYDTDDDKLKTEEAVLGLETGPWELLVGKQYLPFGVYFSNFVSGPLVEFGETQAGEAAVLAYGPGDALDLSLFAYRGRARGAGDNAGRWDWGLATEFWFNRAWSLGVSYQSDLADADSRPLEDDDDRYDRRVAGVSGYVLWAGEEFEATLEGLAATGSFRELDNDRNRPRAWNAELAYVGYARFDIALRFEGSRELEDEPLYQFGAAATWRMGRRASLTVEYLHGEFSGKLASNNDDEPYDHVDRVGAMLSVAF